MNITDNDTDPYRKDESDWPLRNHDKVYMVTTTFNTSDVPLLTPVVNIAARTQALRAH